MFAFFTAEGRGTADRLLRNLAQDLAAQGFCLRGAVQHNVECDPARPCHMDLHILGTDRLVRISQDRGVHAAGCRLDNHGLAEAVFHIEAGLSQGSPDLLIVNKFGKQESAGGGFRSVIGQAMSMGIPVLTTCTAANRAALLAFCDGLATELPASAPDLQSWSEKTRAGAAPSE